MRSKELLLDDRVNAETVFDLSNFLESMILHERVVTTKSPAEVRLQDALRKSIEALNLQEVQFISPPKYMYEKMFEALREYLGTDLIDDKYYQTLADAYGSRMRDDVLDSLRNDVSFFDILTDFDAIAEDFGLHNMPETSRHEWFVYPDTMWKLYGSLHVHLREANRCKDFPFLLIGRTLFYYYAMLEHNTPYKPDALRCPLVRHYVKRTKTAVLSLAERSMRLLEERELTRKRRRDEFWQHETLSLTIPLMLNVVLSSVQNKDDIIDEARALRNSATTRRYRQWCKDLDRQLRNGGNVDRAIEKIVDATRAMNSDFEGPKSGVSIAMVPSIPYSFSQSIRVDQSLLKKGFGSLFRLIELLRDRNVVFIYELKRKTLNIRDISANLKHLFGKGLHHKEYQKLMILYDSDDNDVGHSLA